MNLLSPSDVAALLSSEPCIRLTQSLLHFLWQGLAVGLLLWIGDRVLRRASSQARYVVSVAALLVLLACVPATYVALGNLTVEAPAPFAGQAPTAEAPTIAAIEGSPRLVADDAHMADATPVEVGEDAAATAQNRSGVWNWQTLHLLTPQLAPYATLAYVLGVAIMLARLAMALRSGHRLRQSAAPLTDPAILAMAARQARRIGLAVVPAIAWCQRAAVPLVVGIFKPVILLPTAIASGLAPDQLESLLAHELAHLKRLDLLVNLGQRLAESLLFFHPAVWYVSRRISIERENCCDDCVLAAGWGRVEYADALVRMAEVCATARGLAGLEGAALLAASGGSPSQFKRRVLRLLDAEDHLRLGLSRGWLLAAFAAVLLAITAVPLASRWKTEVKAGQDETSAEAKSSGRDGARRALQAARLERQQYIEQTFPNDERLIKSEVFVAEQTRSKAEESLERAKRLAAKGLIAQAQLEAEDVALKQAQVELTKAQTKLVVLQKFTKAKMLQELDRKIVDAIEALLDQRVALKVTGRPLIFVLDDLEKAHGVPVTIDLKEVRARGVTMHAQVTIDVADKPLREVFKAVLTSAGLDFDVTADGIHVPAKAKREEGAPQGGAAKPSPFTPFECQIVDAVTRKPVSDVTVNFRYKTTATNDAPEEIVSDFFYTNVKVSRFWFQIPKDAIDRPELSIEWGASHPDYEPLSPKERVPLAQVLADDPKSARDTFRIIKLQPKKRDVPPADDQASSTRIRVQYNIPGAEEEGQIFVQHIGGLDIIGTAGSPQLPTNPVKKGDTLELADLGPGDYQVTRHRTIRLGELGMSRFLDRQRFKLKAGETKSIDFTRPTGQPVSGTVLGLKEAGLATAIVNVCSENAQDDRSLGDLEVTVFDARLCAADGAFKTEQLAPGRYTVIVEGYLPLTPEQRTQSGIITPRYIGTARLTVPEAGEAPVVEVELKDVKKVEAGAAEQTQKWGDLTVQLTYDGPRPEPKKFENTRDVALFGREIPDQSLLVGDKGGLANVLAYVTSADVPVHPEERKRAERPVEMKTVDGQLVPRVVPLVVRQKLKLINDTPVHFNFKAFGQRNSGFNVLVAPRDSFQAEFTTAERAPAQITDSIHTWVQAYALPLDHPYAAASGADGVARITNLPAGEWTFRFWHEKSGYLKSAEDGQRDFKIKIQAGANRLDLKVSPEFTVQASGPAGDKPQGATRPAPEPDATIGQALKRAGVSLRIDAEGRVTEIYLGQTATDDMLEQIGRLKNLKKLHIELARQLTAKGLGNLTSLTALQSLALYDVSLPEGSLASLLRQENLAELSIEECGLRDGDLPAIAGLTKLRSLSLRGNAITDAGLAQIVKLTELEELDLGNSSSMGSQMQISDDGLFQLTALTKLKRLNLSSTRLPLDYSAKGLAVLPEFRDLESLQVGGPGLTDQALAHIGRCAQLRSLGLKSGAYTDEGMAEIRNLTKLRAISISGGQLTEAGLLHLGALPELQFAELRTDGVTDRVLESLSRNPSLARLDLYANSRPGVAQSSPPFTGAGLAHFKDHPGLRTLWLTNVAIDARMLAALKGLTQLGELTLMMPVLSDDEVRGLQIALPNTRVSAVWGGHSIVPLQLQPRPGVTKRP